MKFYCIEFETCGFFAQTHEETYMDLICPHCYSMLLIYEDNQRPAELDPERALTRSAAVAHEHKAKFT